MRNSRHIKTAIILVAVMCLVYPAFSGDKQGPKTVTGEIVKINRAVKHADSELFISGPDGSQWRLRLMVPEGVPGAYQVGDLVRVRTMWPDEPVDGDTDGTTDETTETAVLTSEGTGKVALVRNVRNWRTGEKTVYRDGDGNLIQNKHAFKNAFQDSAESGGHAVKTQWRQSGSGTSTGSGTQTRQRGGGGGR